MKYTRRIFVFLFFWCLLSSPLLGLLTIYTLGNFEVFSNIRMGDK